MGLCYYISARYPCSVSGCLSQLFLSTRMLASSGRGSMLVYCTDMRRLGISAQYVHNYEHPASEAWVVLRETTGTHHERLRSRISFNLRSLIVSRISSTSTTSTCYLPSYHHPPPRYLSGCGQKHRYVLHHLGICIPIVAVVLGRRAAYYCVTVVLRGLSALRRARLIVYMSPIAGYHNDCKPPSFLN